MSRNDARLARSRSRIGKTGRVAALIALLSVTATGCSIDNPVLRFGWPSGITPEATEMRELWTWTVIAALAVGVVTWGMMFWAMAFHRRKKGAGADGQELPKQFQYNVPLELFAVVVPTIMVCVLFFFTVTTETDVIRSDKPNPDVKVNVTAFQWNWQFEYPDAKAPGGQPVRTTGSSSQIPLLVLPTDKRIQFHLQSTDVIHSFWVPELLFKRDVFPDPNKNQQNPIFQVSKIDREGAFVGRCAELCGTYHSAMNFELRALSPDKYNQYIGLRKQVNKTTGQPYTAAEALQKMNCGKLCSPTAITTTPFDTDRTARKASG